MVILHIKNKFKFVEHKMKNRYLYSFVIISLFFLIPFLDVSLDAQDLPSNTSTLFAGSGVCALCHSASENIFTTQAGRDISPATLWRSTMMANASNDPVWQAKVAAEVNAHPALQSVIEDKCTTCHMPMGRTEAIYHDANYYSFNEGLADTLSMDGVSCTLCHQIQKDNFGQEQSFSGHYEITNIHEIYGPYTSPTTLPMINQSGYTPVYNEQVHSSELCATCHTLFTPYVDNQGEVAGYFPEQTPYLEWENSIYPANEIECQTCHMPETNEAMKISIMPDWLTTLRSPIYEHEFVGANVFMTSLIKENREKIKATATEDHFDNTIAKTLSMLQEQSLKLTSREELISDSLNIEVSLENMTGHKFPTGFPSRRAWIHLLVRNQDHDTIFESGSWNKDGEIIGLDENYESHHAVIQDQEQVQIYEAIMKDVDGEPTYTLLRGAEYIKDNRLPPKGFSEQNEDYESIAIIGNAADDPDFNPSGSSDAGIPSDKLIYKIPVSEQDQEVELTIELRYQTFSYRFLQDLFSHQIEKVLQFKEYYQKMDMEPVLLTSLSRKIDLKESNSFQTNDEYTDALLKNYPNPFSASTILKFHIHKSSYINLEVHDMLGKKIKTIASGRYLPGIHELSWDGSDEHGNLVPDGIYLASLFTDNRYTDNQISIMIVR